MKYTLRIKKSRTFKYVFKKGKYSVGNYLITHICNTKYENNFNFYVCCGGNCGNFATFCLQIT